MSAYSWRETVWDCRRSRKTSIMAGTAYITPVHDHKVISKSSISTSKNVGKDVGHIGSTKIHGRSPSQPEDVSMSQHCFILEFSASRGEQHMLKTNYWHRHHQCVKSLYVGSQSPLYRNAVCFWFDEIFFHLFKPNMGVLLQYRVRLICTNERQLSATRWSALLHPTSWCACTLCDSRIQEWGVPWCCLSSPPPLFLLFIPSFFSPCWIIEMPSDESSNIKKPISQLDRAIYLFPYSLAHN